MKADFTSKFARSYRDDYVDMYMKGGASSEFAEAFANAAIASPEQFKSVTGAHLAMMGWRGIPPEYAVEAVRFGCGVFETFRMWSDGVPLEYLTAT